MQKVPKTPSNSPISAGSCVSMPETLKVFHSQTGFDTDNDTVFMDETVRDYCRMAGIEFTRCRPYRRTACCTEKEEAREPPFPTDDQATRTEFGCPRSSIWLSTAA